MQEIVIDAPTWIVVIGASAGGVEALRALFGSLRTDLDASFLVVLHIPAHSPSHLDKVLAAVTSMPVTSPEDMQQLERGHVYVASADQHLMLDGKIIRQTRGPKEARVRPAIDVLFRSAAVAYGPRVVGAILSGLLDDGTAGLWAIKDRGGIALVQEPSEAMHASMPESAIRHVAVDLIAPCSDLANRVGEIAMTTPAANLQTKVPEPGLADLRDRLGVENRISSEGNALALGVMKMGMVSEYTCPDCHGVLVQIEEGSIVRFRCHTGHAFSLQTLLAEVSDSIDKGLWDTIRAIEERVLLLRHMRKMEPEDPRRSARGLEALASDTEESIKALKDMVMNVRLFGRQP